MRRANWFIVCSYVLGILVGERFQGLSTGFLWFSITVSCTAVALVFLNSFCRWTLSDRSFNFLFSLCTFLCFLSLGGERSLYYNELKTSEIEVRIAEESDKIKERFSAFVEKNIPDEKSAAIAKALLVGEKGALPRSVKQEFREAGVAHTLALSGLHVGIVWSFLSLLFFFLNTSLRGRKIRVFVISALIFAYAFATGLSNSVVRAAIMLSLWQFNHFFGRKNSGLNSIIAAAFLILLINPASLSSISFQLSFAAVLGIAIMYPVINEGIIFLSDTLPSRFPKKMIVYPLQMMGVSIACQLFTLPIVMYYFGAASQYFLLSNLVVIPSVTLTVYSSSLTLIATLFSDIAGSYGSIITSYAVEWLLQLVQFLAA